MNPIEINRQVNKGMELVGLCPMCEWLKVSLAVTEAQYWFRKFPHPDADSIFRAMERNNRAALDLERHQKTCDIYLKGENAMPKSTSDKGDPKKGKPKPPKPPKGK